MSLAGALTALESVILGKPRQLRLALACLLSRGHLLIEDVPGVGKTTLAHALAQVLAHVGKVFSHRRAPVLRRRHVAVLTDDAARGLRALLPLEMGRFHPGVVRALLVVSGAAELGGAEQRILDRVVMRTLSAGSLPLLRASRRNDVIEVVRGVACDRRDRVTDVAGDGLQFARR